MLSREAAGIRPTSKKNRCLVLTESYTVGEPLCVLSPQMKSSAIFAVLSLKNSFKKSKIGVDMFESKKWLIRLKTTWTCWGMTWRHFLVHKQTLRVLLKIYSHLLKVLNPYVLKRSSLKTPQTVPPTPGTALQNKIESKLEKSLGTHLNIQLQEQIWAFQDSMLEVVVGPFAEIKTGYRGFETERNPVFRMPYNVQ